MGVIKQFLKIISSSGYSYTSERYRDSFLENNCDSSQKKYFEHLQRRIFCFWTGKNEMSKNRLDSLTSLREKSGVEIVLVTPENLDQFILSDFPLHKGFKYLSAVHKSDYLRCYFMHHYGGGYTDIKSAANNWESSFKKLEKQSDKWITGYREIGERGVARVEHPNLAIDLIKNWQYLIGNGAYICRSYTPFTEEWYNELHRRMDIFYPKLVAFPGNIMGDNDGYPIPWTEILGQIFHPLCLKYFEKIIYSNKIKPVLSNYR
jgi:hypothetical protein